MKVRYSYLAEQFSNCDDLWKNLTINFDHGIMGDSQ